MLDFLITVSFNFLIESPSAFDPEREARSEPDSKGLLGVPFSELPSLSGIRLAFSNHPWSRASKSRVYCLVRICPSFHLQCP